MTVAQIADLAGLAARDSAQRSSEPPPPAGLPPRVLGALLRSCGGLTRREQWAAGDAYRTAWTRARKGVPDAL